MIDNADAGSRQPHCRGLAADLDRAVTWVKTYLGSRTVSDWGFFASGVLLGHFLL